LTNLNKLSDSGQEIENKNQSLENIEFSSQSNLEDNENEDEDIFIRPKIDKNGNFMSYSFNFEKILGMKLKKKRFCKKTSLDRIK